MVEKPNKGIKNLQTKTTKQMLEFRSSIILKKTVESISNKLDLSQERISGTKDKG